VAVARRAGTPYAATTAATTQVITIPAATLGGDLILIAHQYNQSTGTTTAPSGYSTLLTQNNTAATMRLVIWYKTAAGTAGSTSTDASASITLTNTGSQRMATVIEVYGGVGGINASAGAQETGSTTNHVCAGVTTTAATLALMFCAERSPSSPSTTITQQSGWIRWNQAWGTGSGTAGIAAGDSQTIQASGASVGGGTWVTDSANSLFLSAVVALAQSGATVDAGVTQTVTPNTTVTLTATESGTSGVTSRAWTEVSGPAAVGFAGAGTTTATFTPTVAGQYVIQYSLTDANGTVSDTVTINVTTSSPRPTVVVNAGGWTAVGASTVPAGLADEDDGTGAVSIAGPDGTTYLEVRMAPASVTPTGVTYNLDATDNAQSISVEVDLRQGNTTVIASWTETLTTSVQTFTHLLTSTQMSSIGDLTDLRLRFTATAT
jgi:hypothetical protein